MLQVSFIYAFTKWKQETGLIITRTVGNSRVTAQCVLPQVVTLHRVSPREELGEPGQLWRAAVCGRRLRHGGERQQRVCTH